MSEENILSFTFNTEDPRMENKLPTEIMKSWVWLASRLTWSSGQLSHEKNRRL